VKFSELIYTTDAERDLVEAALLQEVCNQVDRFTECVIAWCAERGIPAPTTIKEV
jgi:hypothetical protein